MTRPWSDACAAACGIDVLRRAIAPGCGFGRAAQANARPFFRPGDEAAAREASLQAKSLADALGPDLLERLRAEIAATADPSSALARAAAGEVLSDGDFHDLARFGDALADLARFAGLGGLEIPSGDALLAETLAPGRGAGGSFYLADAFAPELERARGAAASAQAAFDGARGRLAARAADRIGLEAIRDGEFVLMRDAVPEPFPAEIRVLREAPTYLLCEIALDGEALAALVLRDEAADAVADAEEAVRARLSAGAATAASGLLAACDALGAIDLLAARAAFAARHAGTVPDVRPGPVELTDATFPPLAGRLSASGRRYVPISIALDGMAVVTGPNMGGKSAALRTLGFCAACAMLGVPVPASAAALPLFDEIVWLGIADGARHDDDTGGLLSAFGLEIAALDSFLRRPAGRALVLVDEFAQTTAPPEGRALLVALLETLRARGVTGIAATHFAGVASAAGATHFVTGRARDGMPAPGAAPATLDAALAGVAASMDYALERVDADDPAGSGALALAAALGLEPELVERAETLLRDGS